MDGIDSEPKRVEDAVDVEHYHLYDSNAVMFADGRTVRRLSEELTAVKTSDLSSATLRSP